MSVLGRDLTGFCHEGNVQEIIKLTDANVACKRSRSVDRVIFRILALSIDRQRCLTTAIANSIRPLLLENYLIFYATISLLFSKFLSIMFFLSLFIFHHLEKVAMKV